MVRGPGLIVASMLLALGGAIAGSLVTLGLSEPRALASERGAGGFASASSTDAALLEAIEELRTEIRTLGRSAVVEREADPPDGASDAALPVASSALERLTDVIESASSRPGESMLVYRSTEPTAAQREHMRDLRAIEYGARQKTHLFWDYQKVLERYGVPDEISGDSSMTWYYQIPQTGESLTLKFCEGLLIAVYD